MKSFSKLLFFGSPLVLTLSFVLGYYLNNKNIKVLPKKTLNINLKTGDCYKLDPKEDWENQHRRNSSSPVSTIIDLVVEGDLSWGFIEYYNRNGRSERYPGGITSLPKKDLSEALLEGRLNPVECPMKETESQKLHSLYKEFFKTYKPYKGNNLDINKIQPGQCFHYLDDVSMFVGQIKRFSVVFQDQSLHKYHENKGRFEDNQYYVNFIKNKDLQEKAMITDCFFDLNEKHKKLKNKEDN